MRSISTACAVAGLLSSIVAGQQYKISTYAGGARPFSAATQATAASIGLPISVATDENGNIYFASPDLNTVFKLDSSGVLTRIAGSSRRGYSGDGGPATEAQLNLIFGNSSAPSSGLAIDKTGNLFIADSSNHCIRRISPDGIITTVAGTGVEGFSGDGGAGRRCETCLSVGRGRGSGRQSVDHGRVQLSRPEGLGERDYHDGGQRLGMGIGRGSHG